MMTIDFPPTWDLEQIKAHMARQGCAYITDYWTDPIYEPPNPIFWRVVMRNETAHIDDPFAEETPVTSDPEYQI